MENQILQIINRISEEIQFTVVVDKDGLPITSFDTNTKKKIDPSLETVIAGTAAAVLTLGEKTSNVLDHGNLEQVVIRNEKGITIILDAGKNALLISILPLRMECDLNTSLTSLKQVASEIAKLKMDYNPSAQKTEESSDILIPEID